ncbi:MAG TPA: DUF4331 family protein [Dehalococcoidia bacterium]|nr:DUF4331 family protein [Dehalococcoidia bacterium]
MKKPLFLLAGLALVAAAGLGSLATAGGADHRDSPLNVSNPTADINDVYAFRGANPNNLVLAISLNPLIAPSDNNTRGRFDPRVQYQVHIDRTGDLVDEATVNIRMTTQADSLIIEGLGAPITAPITPPNAATPVITTTGGVSVFAGLRDDPFFFDLTGFQGFVANPQVPAAGLRPAGAGQPADAFAGTNILAIVIEAPVTAVTGAANANTGTIRTWVSTTRDGQRIDRMAIPAINTALIPSAQKDAFNAGNPINDATAFRPAALATINTLRGAVDRLFGPSSPQNGGPLGPLNSEQVAAALIPDVVTINFAQALQFPNGRRLQDDVVDAALGVVLNRGGAAGVSDGVNANDRAFLPAFPYLAEPHQPAAAAASPIRPPSTGDAGMASDGTLWALAGAMAAVAAVLGSAGVFMARRKAR